MTRLQPGGDYVYNAYGFYAQGQWRVTHRVTLNLGLRYEMRLDGNRKNGPEFIFRNLPVDNGINTPPAGGARPFLQNDFLRNFSPQFAI